MLDLILLLNHGDFVDQFANRIYTDSHFVFVHQREGIGWNDASPGEQQRAIGKAFAASQVFSEVGQGAVNIPRGGFAFEDKLILATNGEVNAYVRPRRAA